MSSYRGDVLNRFVVMISANDPASLDKQEVYRVVMRMWLGEGGGKTGGREPHFENPASSFAKEWPQHCR